jgi:hypothetical protein
MEGVGEISTAAAADPPGDAETKEIPADASELGQLPSRYHCMYTSVHRSHPCCHVCLDAVHDAV